MSVKYGKICAMYGCKNYSKQKDARSFYSFPGSPEMLKKWIQACKRQDLHDLYRKQKDNFKRKSYSVCSDHFDISCFRNRKLFSQGLFNGSVPTLSVFNKPKPLPGRKTVNSRGASTKEIEVKRDPDPTPNVINKPNALPAPDVVTCNSFTKIIEVKRGAVTTLYLENHPDNPPDLVNFTDASKDVEPKRIDTVEANVECLNPKAKPEPKPDSPEVQKLKLRVTDLVKRLRNKTTLCCKLKSKNKILKAAVAAAKAKPPPPPDNTPFGQFMYAQTTLKERNKFGRRYSDEIKERTMELYRKSPSSYKLVKSMFCLPSLSCVQRLINIKENSTKQTEVVKQSQNNSDSMEVPILINLNLLSDNQK